jgi:hypothetical protein
MLTPFLKFGYDLRGRTLFTEFLGNHQLLLVLILDHVVRDVFATAFTNLFADFELML